MARIRIFPDEPSRPQYPPSQESIQNSNSHNSQPPRSSAHTPIVVSDDEAAVVPQSSGRRPTTDSDEDKQLPRTVKANTTNKAGSDTAGPPAKKRRGKRMLKGLSENDILTPESIVVVDVDDGTIRPRERMSGLKVPDIDTNAVRRSSRREAKKPVVYNMRIHPQDYAIPYQRNKLDDSITLADDSEEEQYKPDARNDNSDVIKTTPDSELGDIDEDDRQVISSTPRMQVPDPNATRRSSRTSAARSVHYDMSVHPNDHDIGIRSGGKRKSMSQTASRKSVAQTLMPIVDDSDPDETASEPDQPHFAAAELLGEIAVQDPVHEDTHNNVDTPLIEDLFGKQSHVKVQRNSSDKSVLVVPVEDELGSQFSNISMDAEPDIDGLTRIPSADTSKTLDDEEVHPVRDAALPMSVSQQNRSSNTNTEQTFSSMQVLTSQVPRAATPNLDFSVLLSQSYNEHMRDGSPRPQRISDGSRTLSEDDDDSEKLVVEKYKSRHKASRR